MPSCIYYRTCIQYLLQGTILLIAPPLHFTLVHRARICKRLRSPGIDSKESIPPAYVAWRADTSNRVVVPACQAINRFLGSLKGLQIRALYCALYRDLFFLYRQYRFLTLTKVASFVINSIITLLHHAIVLLQPNRTSSFKTILYV